MNCSKVIKLAVVILLRNCLYISVGTKIISFDAEQFIFNFYPDSEPISISNQYTRVVRFILYRNTVTLVYNNTVRCVRKQQVHGNLCIRVHLLPNLHSGGD